MTRNNFFKVMMFAMMAMVGANAFAQGRATREMHIGNGGVRMEHRADGMGGYGYDAVRHDGYRNDGYRHESYRNEGHHYGGYRNEGHHHDNRYGNRHAGHMAPPAHHHPHFDSYGYLPGWEGRVCYRDGRYGYLRDNAWYWYDTYYAPDYYYAHPIAHFHAHRLSPEGRAVVTAVAGAAIIGSIISAIAY